MTVPVRHVQASTEACQTIECNLSFQICVIFYRRLGSRNDLSSVIYSFFFLFFLLRFPFFFFPFFFLFCPFLSPSSPLPSHPFWSNFILLVGGSLLPFLPLLPSWLAPIFCSAVFPSPCLLERKEKRKEKRKKRKGKKKEKHKKKRRKKKRKKKKKRETKNRKIEKKEKT